MSEAGIGRITFGPVVSRLVTVDNFKEVAYRNRDKEIILRLSKMEEQIALLWEALGKPKRRSKRHEVVS